MDELAKASAERTTALKELTSSVSAFIRRRSQSATGASPSLRVPSDERLQAVEDTLHALTTRHEALLGLGSTRSSTLETISLLEKRLERVQREYAALLEA